MRSGARVKGVATAQGPRSKGGGGRGIKLGLQEEAQHIGPGTLGFAPGAAFPAMLKGAANRACNRAR